MIFKTFPTLNILSFCIFKFKKRTTRHSNLITNLTDSTTGGCSQLHISGVREDLNEWIAQAPSWYPAVTSQTPHVLLKATSSCQLPGAQLAVPWTQPVTLALRGRNPSASALYLGSLSTPKSLKCLEKDEGFCSNKGKGWLPVKMSGI